MSDKEFENIEIDIDEDTVKVLAKLIENRYITQLDECSQSLYVTDTITTMEDLQLLVGGCIVNSIIVESLVELIEKKEDQSK